MIWGYIMRLRGDLHTLLFVMDAMNYWCSAEVILDFVLMYVLKTQGENSYKGENISIEKHWILLMRSLCKETSITSLFILVKIILFLIKL